MRMLVSLHCTVQLYSVVAVPSLGGRADSLAGISGFIMNSVRIKLAVISPDSNWCRGTWRGNILQSTPPTPATRCNNSSDAL